MMLTGPCRGIAMTTSKQAQEEKRLEDIELQVESLMEQQCRMEKLLNKIDGGLTAMKWLAAIIGVLITLWEIV